MSLSRNYTLLTLMGLIRMKSGKLQNTLLTRSMLIDTIYTCLLEIARELKEADTPEFGLSVAATIASDKIDLTSIDGASTKINVESIVKLVDATNGLLIPTDAVEFNYLADYPQKQNDIFWYRDGELIYLYKGTGVSAYGVVTLHYDRIPEKAIADATLIDLSDRFIPLLISKILEVVG